MKKLVQRLLFGIGILSLGITFTGCHASHSQTDSQKTISRQTEPQAGPAQTETSSTLSLIDASGMTLESRIHTPDGYRIRVNGNNVSWIKSAQPDTSYDSLKDYLRIVFSYAGTASMDTEAQPIPLSDLQVGDVFLKGGNPGHVVMVVDLCENADGKKAFLLAQGYMPAQQFHVLKNPAHEDDPWYYEDEVTYPFHTPEYTFQKGSLKRLNYGITHTAPE